jgi:hypothetical protein
LPDAEPLISKFCKTVDVYRQVFGTSDAPKAQAGVSNDLKLKLTELINSVQPIKPVSAVQPKA